MAASRQRTVRSERSRVGPPVVYAPPGTLTVDPNAEPTRIHVVAYGPDGVEELHLADLRRVARLRMNWPVVWVHVIGLGNADAIARIGAEFGLHALALEDAVHTHQRPKVQVFGEVTQIVVRIVEELGSARTEQLTIFVGQGFVVSFEERRQDIFEVVRDRIRARSPRMCEAGPDFLAYSLLDVAVDAFFPVLEDIGDQLERIEDAIPRVKPHATLPHLRRMKRRLLGLRRAIWPMREVLGTLASTDSPAVAPETRMYLRDCQDHCAQILDILTSNREQHADLVALDVAIASQRLNEVMKVLTVVATTFIPLTFISSVYGMNFDPSVSAYNMPELRWAHGYLFALGLMAIVAVGLLVFFRRRGWL